MTIKIQCLVNTIFTFLMVITIISCGAKKEMPKQNKTVDATQNENNAELEEIYRVDQADRQTDEIDWEIVSRNDSLREVRIYELLASNEVLTSKDYHNAAMIFQHGKDSVAYGMAVKLMQKSIDLDPNANKWLLAAATDRYLLSVGKPQIYGTQYQKSGNEEPWRLGNMDTTQISDEIRREYGVESLAGQRERVRIMNLKKISELVSEGETIDQIIEFIKSEDEAKSEYNFSENGLNAFGYDLMGNGKNDDALKIFKLNTELFPEAYNTYDSYGECLTLIGRKKEGIEAYKKSLELNPENENARIIIEENK